MLVLVFIRLLRLHLIFTKHVFLYMSSEAHSLFIMFNLNSTSYIMFIIDRFFFTRRQPSTTGVEKKGREGGANTHAHECVILVCSSYFFSTSGCDTRNFCRLKRIEKKESNTHIYTNKTKNSSVHRIVRIYRY